MTPMIITVYLVTVDDYTFLVVFKGTGNWATILNGFFIIESGNWVTIF